MTNKNVLDKTRTYLVGHMQYSDGRNWRENEGSGNLDTFFEKNLPL